MATGLLVLVLVMTAVIGIAGGIAAGGWILGPLAVPDKAVRNPTQFRMVDLLCLFVVLQIPLAWAATVATVPGFPGVWVVSGVLVAYFGMVWWVGVQKLSQARIQNPWHRGLFLVLVFPGTLFGTILFIVVAIADLGILVSDAPNGPPSIALVLTAIDTGLGLCLYAFGRFTRRMVATAVSDAVEQEK